MKDMILATRWTAKGRTKEPQEEKKGVRALIDDGAETLISIITHLKVWVCALGGIGGQGGGMISMKHSAITLKSPGAVRIYLPKVLVCAQVQSTQKLVNPPKPISGMPAHPSPAAPSDQSGRPAANSLR